MSVLVSDRKESRFEVIVFAEELNLMLIDLMHRSFGIKDMAHLVRVEYARGNLKTEDVEYYRSVLDCSKRNIMHIAALLTNNVRAANSIYPISDAEWEQRRGYQNSAIVNCEQIIKELQHIVRLFNVDINIYGRYINALDREINLIKRWRQKDRKHMSAKSGSI